jgi:tetratricopeptide (TPR) repeat protein
MNASDPGGDDKSREARAALAAARARFALAPNDSRARGALAQALAGFGDLLKSRGDLDGALAAYREGLAVERGAAALADKIGAVLVMKSALAAHRTEAERQEAPDRGPDAPRRDAAWNLARAGDLLATRGDPASALALYREAIRQRRALAAHHPENPALLEDVAWRLGTLGDVLAAQGDDEGALAAQREAVEMRRALLARNTQNPGALRDLSWSLGRLGDALAKLQDDSGALAAYREDVEIIRRLRLVEPASEDMASYLAITLGKLGDFLAARDDMAADALAAYRECLALRREILTAQAENDALRNDICITLGKIGQALAAAGEFAGALDHHREALTLRRALAAKHPGSAAWGGDVAWSEERVSELLEKLPPGVRRES